LLSTNAQEGLINELEEIDFEEESGEEK